MPKTAVDSLTSTHTQSRLGTSPGDGGTRPDSQADSKLRYEQERPLLRDVMPSISPIIVCSEAGALERFLGGAVDVDSILRAYEPRRIALRVSYLSAYLVKYSPNVLPQVKTKYVHFTQKKRLSLLWCFCDEFFTVAGK